MLRKETIDAFCKYLTDKAYKAYDKDTCGKCGIFTREAVESSIKPQKVTRTLSAKNYGPSYEKVGFEKVFSYPEQAKKNYSPLKGDLCIINYEPHGHICIYTGKVWISDFYQRDMYGGSIRDEDPPFTIYRLKEESVETLPSAKNETIKVSSPTKLGFFSKLFSFGKKSNA